VDDPAVQDAVKRWFKDLNINTGTPITTAEDGRPGVFSGDSTTFTLPASEAQMMETALRFATAMALIVGLADAKPDEALANVQWEDTSSVGGYRYGAGIRFPGESLEDQFNWESE
jgi:hypothetical protein